MSLFRKKKEVVVDEPDIGTPSDDANWHVWDNAGRGMLGMNLVADAVYDYCQAIDRFDGNQRDLERLKSRIAEAVLSLVWELVPSYKTVPVHIIADIDREISVKHPDMDSDPTVTDLIADGCDGLIERCSSAGEVYMVGACALYCSIGYMRYSFDPTEDILRCARAQEVCSYCADKASGKMKVKG